MKNIKYTSKYGETKVLCKECHKEHATWDLINASKAEATKEPCSVCGK